MRRSLGVATAAAALLAANMAVVSAAHAEDPQRETLRLQLRSDQSEEIDLGDDGLSLGDKVVFTDRVREDGDRVGEAHGECTVVFYDDPDVGIQCLVTLALDDGQITLQGAVAFEEDDDRLPRFKMAVTGGTDDFRGASGEATVRQRSDERTDVRVRLD